METKTLNVVLATFRNSLYCGAFEEGGTLIRELAQPFSRDDAAHGGVLKGEVYVIFELKGDNRDSLEALQSQYAGARFICITEKFDQNLKAYLLTRGVVDLLVSPGAGEPAEYLRIISGPSSDNFGKIVLYDDDPAACFIIKAIARGFGYPVLSVDSPDSLFEKITLPTVQAALVNLGASGLRLKDLVNRSYSCAAFKSTPVIIYKDMTKGIFVHEIVSGLNRIASCIVDYHELFSFLVLNLYKKRMIPVYRSMGRTLNSEENDFYAKETLSRIIFSKGSSLFEGDDACYHEAIESMISDIEAMNSISTLMKGFVWMIDRKKENIITCGGGAAGLHLP